MKIKEYKEKIVYTKEELKNLQLRAVNEEDLKEELKRVMKALAKT